MSEIEYTTEELDEFRRLSDNLASRMQAIRHQTRLDSMPKFIAEHGRAKCDVMYKVLLAEDEAKRAATEDAIK